MKAVIENKEGVYLIRIYGSDGLCDTYVVEKIYYSEEGRRVDMRIENWYEEVRG